MDRHDGTEHSEDHVGTPLDVREGRGDEVCQGKVECPVRGTGQTDTLGTVFQGEDLRGIDPRGWRLGREVRSDEMLERDERHWFTQVKP